MKRLIVIMLLILMFPLNCYASQNSGLMAAFIQNDDLWIKMNDRELKITTGDYVRYPKWSYDGKWIAYLKGPKQDYFFNGELWVYNRSLKKHFKISANADRNFLWSPSSNTLGYLTNKNLYVKNVVKPNQAPDTPIDKNVENFSWFPNGNSLLISSKKSSELNSDIILRKVTIMSGKPKTTHFFTVPVSKEEFLVSTSQFKWSFNQKWISFLLVPTASLSADANILCILSDDGKIFHRKADMLKDEEWFKWAPSANVLGFINGVGREATTNKNLEVLKVPSMFQNNITPNGFVDRDLSWQNNTVLYVSRSRESEWVEQEKRPLPSLYKLNLNTNRQVKITNPTDNEGDFAPSISKNKLVWIRTNRETAEVYTKTLRKAKEKLWIKNISMPTWYYEKWNWDEVFSLYRGK